MKYRIKQIGDMNYPQYRAWYTLFIWIHFKMYNGKLACFKDMSIAKQYLKDREAEIERKKKVVHNFR